MQKKSIKNIIKEVAEKLGLKEAENYIDTGEGDEKTAKKLLKFYNEVEKDIAIYLPIYTEEKVRKKDGKIYYDSLSKPFLRTAYLLDSGRHRLDYKAYSGYLVAENAGIIGYSYQPADKGFDDSAECADYTPTKVFTMGIIAAYYFDRQLFDDSEIYARQYESALYMLGKAQGIGKCAKLPTRGWR